MPRENYGLKFKLCPYSFPVSLSTVMFDPVSVTIMLRLPLVPFEPLRVSVDLPVWVE